MRSRLLPCIALLAAATASALDASDAGTYRILNQQGQPTAKVFRLAGTPGSWRIEDKQSDGTWVDVTCEGGCVLKPSEEADHRRFFPVDDLSKVSLSCIHNEAFAFCRYSRSAEPGERGYVFIALTERYPIPLRVARE
jgi:hypothetical protein